MDGLALPEGEAAPADREGDVADRLQVHLDPAQGIVPDRLVAKSLDRNVPVQFGIDPVQQVEVEGRGHPRRIVIGADQDVDVLDPVHADDELRALAKRLLHRTQQIDGAAGDEITDRRAREETELRRALYFSREREGPGEVRLDRIDGQLRKFALQRRRAFTEEVAADVDRHIGARLHRAEQDRGLCRGAGAEFDHRLAAAHPVGDLAAPAFEQGSLGRGWIIFGKPGNLLEQLRAPVIVEPARRNGRRRRGKAGEHVGAKRRINVADEGLDIGHQASRARRRPEYIQRWCG